MRSATLSGERLSSLLPTKRTGPKTRRGDRLFLDAVIYRLKTGVPWRDLPSGSACGKSVYNRFANWSRRGLWLRILSRYSSTSMTRVRSSTLPSSARTKTLRAEKRSRPIVWSLSRRFFDEDSRRRGPARAASVCHTDARPASRNHRRPAAHRARARPGFPADTAYDSSELIQQLDERGMQVVICQHPRRKTGCRPPLASCTASAFRRAILPSPQTLPRTRHRYERPPVTTSRCSTSPAPSSGSIGTALAAHGFGSGSNSIALAVCICHGSLWRRWPRSGIPLSRWVSPITLGFVCIAALFPFNTNLRLLLFQQNDIHRVWLPRDESIVSKRVELHVRRSSYIGPSALC